MHRFDVAHPAGAYQWEIQFTRLDSDPTGNLPEFQLIPVDGATDDATLDTWTDGAWTTVGYDADRNTAWAATPLIGAGGLTVAAGRSYRLLARLDLGNGLTPIHDLGRVVVAGSHDQPRH